MGHWIAFNRALIIISALILTGNSEAVELEELGLQHTASANQIEFTVTNDTYDILKVSCTAIGLKNVPNQSSGLRIAANICDNLFPCTTYLALVTVKNLETAEESEKPVTVNTTYVEPYVEVTQVTPFPYSVYVSWHVLQKSCLSGFNIRANSNSNDSTFQASLGNDQTDIEIMPLRPCLLYTIDLKGLDVNKTEVPCSNCVVEVATEYADPEGVTNIQFETVNNDSVRVKWDPPVYTSCIEYYYLKWTRLECVENGSDEKCTWIYHNLTDTHAREYTINNLEGCDLYGVIIAINGAQINNSTWTEFTSPEQITGDVKGIKLEPIESTNVTIEWSPPQVNGKCADHYRLLILGPEDDDDRFDIDLKTNETSAVIYGMDPCRWYNFSIMAITESLYEGPDTKMYFSTVEDTPGTIENVTIDLSPGQISLQWYPPEFAKYCVKDYRISMWATDEPNNPSYKFDKVTNVTFETIKDLVSCQLYTVQIIPVTHLQQDGNLTQIDAETVPTVSARPRNPEATIHSHSLELETQDVDQYNKCPILYAKFVCETDKDVLCKEAEETVEGRISDVKFRGVVRPLSPFTQYVCKVSLFNIAGWSANSTAIITTSIYFPTEPEEIRTQYITNSSILYRWDAPKYPNGKVSVYQLHFRYVGPAFYQPKGCAKPTEVAISTETSRLENEFRNVKAFSRYSVQIAANNDYGTGPYTYPFFVITDPWVSEPVNSFDISAIDGPDIDAPTYKSSVTLKWELPCQSNGEIREFILDFIGYRDGYAVVNFVRVVSLPSSITDTMTYTETELLPEYSYNVSITVINKQVGDFSRPRRLNFLAPAGIPESVQVEGFARVDAFESSNPTTSAVVRFPLSILNSEKGDILYAALLVSEKDCQPNPEMVYNKLNSMSEWPEICTWSDVYDNTCIAQYQTTPVRWSPVTVVRMANDDARRLPRNVGDYDGDNLNDDSNDYLDDDIMMDDIVEYIIGTEHCLESGGNGYCNGPLRPDTKYQLVIRLFTRSGFNDAGILEFKTDSVIRIYVILIAVISCLMLAFLAGFLYLYITKRLIWHRDSSHGIEDPTGDVTSKNFQLYYFEIAKREKLQREFKELQVIAIDLSVSASRTNESKNRYTNIFPYDKNRVILDIDFDGSDYINASFINGYHRKKEYIATQGPKPETFIDFWRMVLQHSVKVIVMVTQFKEGETIKCHQYFPTIPSKEMKFGNYITVLCKKESFDDLYERREMLVTHTGDGFSRKIVHYYFKKWPDHDCPTDPAHLIQFVRKVKSEKISSHSPIVVHCSAGVGRTGTFIGLDIIMQRLKSEGKINIFETIKELRFQRMKMVQTIQQYTFLYTCAYQLLFIKKQSSHFKFKNETKKGVSFKCDSENGIQLSDECSSIGDDNIQSFNRNNIESIM